MEDNVAKPLLSKLAALPEYKDAFISGNSAFISAQPGALLGGEPFEPKNQRALLPFLRRVRRELPRRSGRSPRP